MYVIQKIILITGFGNCENSLSSTLRILSNKYGMNMCNIHSSMYSGLKMTNHEYPNGVVKHFAFKHDNNLYITMSIQSHITTFTGPHILEVGCVRPETRVSPFVGYKSQRSLLAAGTHTDEHSLILSTPSMTRLEQTSRKKSRRRGSQTYYCII